MNWWAEQTFVAGVSASVSFFVAKITIKNGYYENKIDSICKNIQYITEKAAAYWSTEGNDPPIERRINSTFLTINSEILELKVKLVNRYHIESKLRQLRREVTGGSFESPQKDPEPGRVNLIEERADELRSLIKKCKPKYF